MSCVHHHRRTREVLKVGMQNIGAVRKGDNYNACGELGVHLRHNKYTASRLEGRGTAI